MIQRWLLIAFLTLAFASASIHANPNEITWKQMEDLNFETGEMPDNLRQYHEQTVKVAGFIVPLEMEDTIEEVIEFLLVPDPLACIHVPPPPPNQMIMVTMTQPVPLDMNLRGVEIIGKLNIVKTKHGDYSFELAGTSSKKVVIEYEDPLMEFLIDY